MSPEQERKEGKTEREKNIDFLVGFAYRGTENLSLAERELIAFARLEELGFKAPREVEKEVGKAKKSGQLGKYLLWAGFVAAGAGAGYWAGGGSEKKEGDSIIQPKPVAKRSEKTITYQEAQEAIIRFDSGTYERLSDNGKRVYNFVRENDPTPGKTYVILDKPRAILYLIDKNNKLIADSSVVIGTDLGEGQNTSVRAKEGSQTTPAGVYVIGKKTGLQEKDAIQYGGNSFTLWGISVKGDKVFLGWHQTYSDPKDPNEFKNRTQAMKKIAEGAAQDPRKEGALSDGCVNSPEEFFEKYAKLNLEGSGFELMYILYDADSSGREPAFEPKEIIGKIKPIMAEVQEIEKEAGSVRNN